MVATVRPPRLGRGEPRCASSSSSPQFTCPLCRLLVTGGEPVAGPSAVISACATSTTLLFDIWDRLFSSSKAADGIDAIPLHDHALCLTDEVAAGQCAAKLLLTLYDCPCERNVGGEDQSEFDGFVVERV